MAVEIAWLHEGLPIFGFILVFVLAYAIIAKTKILGESKWINGIISLILGIIFLSFSSVREYVTNITPWFAVLITLLFFFFFIIAFVIKDDITKFTKPLTIVFLILMALVIIIALFYTFPSTRALLPGTWSTECDNDWDYNYDYYDYGDCDKRDGYYKCYTSHTSYTYDKCVKENEEYQCYDYDNYNIERDSCRGNDDVFEKLGDYIYKDERKVINSFWLILSAVIVGIIITRG